MKFNLENSKEILQRTPAVLNALLSDLSSDWTKSNEGGESWSPYDVVGHLVYGEQVDWMTRTKIILEFGTKQAFTPFDRFAQFHLSRGKTLKDLLQEFESLRMRNLIELDALGLKDEELDTLGMHPELGEASLRQLLSAWTVHDLGHIAQIARTMARQFDSAVGPWKAYLGILHR